LHEDWHRYGGIDIYLTKFSVSNLTVLVAESATHVIVVARDSTFNAKTDSASLRQAAYDYAKILLSSTFVPDVPEDLRTIRQGPSPAFLYGYYTTRLNKLTGRTDDQTTLTETSDSANALSVRFFTNGQMVAFMTLKAVDDPRELGNPFEPRFGLLRDQGEGDPFARPRVEQPGERQLEEYLGLLMTPQEQRTFLELVPMESLEKSFLNLSREQQIAMVRLKMTDEYLAAGMKAFLDKKFDDAIQYWLRNLQLDPENPRVGLLLSLAVDRRIERTFGGDRNRARSDSAISQATKAIRDQQVLLKRREESREVVAARERAIVDHRTQALQAMSEGNLEDSLRHWDNILRLDPGNANAQVFRDLVQNRIERGDRRQPSQRLPSSNRTR
jgi:tetratricopeptide (TPR) repeat protein